MTESGRMATITRNIVQMGHDLSLEVLAEGVETEAELRMMLSYGCRLFQGYLLRGRPASSNSSNMPPVHRPDRTFCNRLRQPDRIQWRAGRQIRPLNNAPFVG